MDKTAADVGSSGSLSPSRSWRGWLLERARSLVELTAVVFTLPTWGSLTGRWWWVSDLAGCFVWQSTTILVVAAPLCWLLRARRVAFFAVSALAINLVLLAPLYWPTSTSSNVGPRLRVMTLNVLTSNRRHEEVLRLVEREDPDALVLLEADQNWLTAMAPLDTSYPHQEHLLHEGNFSVLFYTRLEVHEKQIVHEPDTNSAAYLHARLDWQGQELTLIGAHPFPPGNTEGAASRNRQLRHLAGLTQEAEGPVVLMGDLNITRFSPHFGDLLRMGNLRDSSIGRGYRATWSMGVDWLALPIDHVLQSDDLTVVNRRVGPDVGSDHRAVTVEFAQNND